MVLALKYTGLLWVLQLFTRLVGGKGHHGSVFSREDFTVMTDMAHKEGVFEESESTIMKNLLRFTRIQVKDVMTPRAVVKIASDTTSIRKFFEDNPKLRFSRIPVFNQKMDNITGFVLKDNVYEEIINVNGEKPLAEIKRNIITTQRSVPIPKLFDTFIKEQEQIALVFDEYGSVAGIITMEDIIETLLGLEIIDESDHVADMQSLARENWKKRAAAAGVFDKKPKDNGKT